MDAARRAGVRLDAVEIEGLRQAAMGEEKGLGAGRRTQPGGVVEIGEGRERNDESEDDQQNSFHNTTCSLANRQLQFGRKTARSPAPFGCLECVSQ
jgi:hypothetical protein